MKTYIGQSGYIMLVDLHVNRRLHLIRERIQMCLCISVLLNRLRTRNISFGFQNEVVASQWR